MDRKKRRELFTGIIGIAIIGMFFVGINYLRGVDVFSNDRIFYAEFNSIKNISKKSAIMVNGIKVGLVKRFYFDKTSYDKIIMELSIEDENLKIPEDSKVSLVSANILGSKEVFLNLGKSSIHKQEGDTLDAFVELSMISSLTNRITPYENKINHLMKSFENALEGISKLLSDKNNQNIEKLLVNVNNLLVSTNMLSKKVNTRVDELNPTIKKSGQLLTKLNAINYKKTVNNLNESLNELKRLSKQVQSKEGTVGKLIHTPNVHDNLNKLILHLDKLIVDINNKPKKYVHFSIFGRKNKEK